MKERYRRFKEWEKQPHQVAPLSEKMHECATCGTHYKGNYCPRCGQSMKIGRYSFKNALLLFLDVWGIGNRGMFRSIRDLLLRPGYMIRDYLKGMQMAYFPPFKMYFLLFTLSLLIDSGLNIQGINRMEDKEEKVEAEATAKADDAEEKQTAAQIKKTVRKAGSSLTKEEKKQLAKKELNRIIDVSTEWIEQHASIALLISLLLFSCPLWLLFRHSPSLPDIRLSECFVAMVYISNMLLIYNIIPSLLCFSKDAENIYEILTMLLVIIPVKQLSGFSYWSTIWRVPLAAVSFFTIAMALFVAGAFLYAKIYVALI
ncbi:MAG: DUF3667 domain-containing protein [Prevotella sp.]|nr:DUF3667 domain-containing protein [Prevotella sp.]